MTDTAREGDSIERSANVDIQYTVFGIPPQFGGFDVLTVTKVIEIRERLLFGHLIEKRFAFIVDRG